jgi:hypothetical protein
MAKVSSVLFALVLAAGVSGCKKDNPPAAPPPTPDTSPTKPSAPTTGGSAANEPAGPDNLHAEGKGYVVEVSAPAETAVGAQATTTITLKAQEGFHLNQEFPLALTLTAPAGLTIDKPTLAIADATKYEAKEGTWAIAQTAKAAGAQQVRAHFKFAVCTDATCDPQRVELAWTVPVK